MPDDARWLTEADVVSLVDLPAATEALRSTLRLEPSDSPTRAHNMDKTSIVFGEGDSLHAVGGHAEGLAGTKTWAHTASGATPLLILWDAATGALRAVIEAFALGQMRTAAVSSVATDVLADPAADTMAIIGTGKQALPQVAAVAAARPVRSVRVYSPSADHRSAFATRLRGETAVDVEVSGSVADAVAGADVVTTVTRAREPFLHAAMLQPRAHVNAVGAISPERRELADDVAGGASLVVSDSPETARRLSRELDSAAQIHSLGSVLAGEPSARRQSTPGRTVFKAMGLGLADVGIGSEVWRRAVAAGRGRPIPAVHKAVPRWFGGGHQ